MFSGKYIPHNNGIYASLRKCCGDPSGKEKINFMSQLTVFFRGKIMGTSLIDVILLINKVWYSVY